MGGLGLQDGSHGVAARVAQGCSQGGAGVARLGPGAVYRVQLARDPLVPLQVVGLEDGREAPRADELEDDEAARVGPAAERARLMDHARLRLRGAVAQLLARRVELLQQLQLAEVLVLLPSPQGRGVRGGVGEGR